MSDTRDACEQFMSIDQLALMSEAYTPGSLEEHKDVASKFKAFSDTVAGVLQKAKEVVVECRKRKLENARLEEKIKERDEKIAACEAKIDELERALVFYSEMVNWK
jgi:hypothetical protein